MTEKATRPWIAEVRAKAAADTVKHHEAWSRNWAKGQEERLAGERLKVPCASCGTPVPESTIYEYSLCDVCAETKPQPFLDWVKAEELCRGALASAEAKGARDARVAARLLGR